MKIMSIAIAGLLLSSCGPELGNPNENSVDSDGANDQEFVTIGVGLQESAVPIFGLAAATSFQMSLDGCASGLAYSSITQSNPNIEVYKFDKGCLVKLEQFVFGGITYVPQTGGSPDHFSSWLAGDVATFEESTNPANQMIVSVVSQLDDPISGTETVSYAFAEIDAGTNETIAKNIVSDQHNLEVTGTPAPNFSISAVAFNGITVTGAGQFTFTLDCGAAMSGSSCSGLDLTDVKLKLIEDSYSGTLTLAQAAALFPADEQSPASSHSTGNGGFLTPSLQGPDQMHNNPNMILILEASDTSYIYYNIDITTLSYP